LITIDVLAQLVVKQLMKDDPDLVWTSDDGTYPDWISPYSLSNHAAPYDSICDESGPIPFDKMPKELRELTEHVKSHALCVKPEELIANLVNTALLQDDSGKEVCMQPKQAHRHLTGHEDDEFKQCVIGAVGDASYGYYLVEDLVEGSDELGPVSCCMAQNGAFLRKPNHQMSIDLRIDRVDVEVAFMPFHKKRVAFYLDNDEPACEEAADPNDCKIIHRLERISRSIATQACLDSQMENEKCWEDTKPLIDGLVSSIQNKTGDGAFLLDYLSDSCVKPCADGETCISQ
jgi:hypothetical protein